MCQKRYFYCVDVILNCGRFIQHWVIGLLHHDLFMFDLVCFISYSPFSTLQVFEGLIAGTLPVYKGAPSIHKFMPHNTSYIDANALNPKQLADKLTFLASNEEEYNKYFAYKSQPLSKDFENMALMSYVHPNVVCRLCDYAMNINK